VKRTLSRILDFGLYAAIAVVAYGFLSRKFSGPKEGVTAAAIDLPLASGTNGRFRLDEHRGKPVLIEMFASWCHACQRAAPTLSEAFHRHGAEGVTFVGVSVDGSTEDARRVKDDWKIPYDVAVDDGRVSKAYGIEVLPTFVLVDRQGRVQRVSTGAPSTSELDRWLKEL
jgi:thiol-disulfide isomerase/thioredoxin